MPISVWMELVQLQRDKEYVFVSCRGKPIDRTMAHRIIKDAVQKAGVNPKISAHWLRHSHASIALAKGASIALVRDTLGHSNIQVTNVYVHSNPVDSSSNYLGM